MLYVNVSATVLVLIKVCGRNDNIEHNKQILISIPCGILGRIWKYL